MLKTNSTVNIEEILNFLSPILDENQIIKQCIAGEFIKSSQINEVSFPFDRSNSIKYYVSEKNDVYEGIELASQVIKDMKALTLYQRADIINKVANSIESNKEILAKIIVFETGKTIKDSRAEIVRVISTLKFCVEAIHGFKGEGLPLDATEGTGKRVAFTVKEPIGVVAAITGFNFPLLLAVHKVGPAFGAGNAVILKPSPGTPIITLVLASLFIEAGLPKGALSVVNGDREVGELITTHPKVAAVSFTGSSEIGKKISKQAEYKKVLLELGSNAATIIDDLAEDISLEYIANRLVQGGFASNGQSCISVQRIICNKRFTSELIDILKSSVKKLKVGNPLEEDTDISQLFTLASLNRIENLIAQSIDKGAVVEYGASTKNGILQPTILSNVSEDMSIFQEEIFGPVILITEYENFEDAINIANNSKYGLQAGVYTNNLSHMLKAINEIDCGGVHINEISNFRPDHMPYGGVKDSGIGKEGPLYVLEELSISKVVTIKF